MMKRNKGFGLIEVMVALLVIAIGVMGLMSLQTYTLREAKETEYYNRANFLAKDMFERMRGNFAGVVAGQYSVAPSSTAPTTCVGTTACDKIAMAAFDLFEFCKDLRKELGHEQLASTADNCSYFPARITTTRIPASERTVNGVTFDRYTATIQVQVAIEKFEIDADGNQSFSRSTDAVSSGEQTIAATHLTFTFTSEI